MFALEFIKHIQQISERVMETQAETIEQVAKYCAEAIASGHWVHLFGTGHSSIPVMEVFPRIGSFIGFHPINEINLSFNSQVVGSMAQRQASFLEQVEGYAGVIAANYEFSPEDILILFSHSGINPLIVEMALVGKEKGTMVVAVTSLEHSRHHASRSQSGLRLFEVADITIDTCAPEGDALIQIAGMDSRVGGSSTILSCIIGNSLVAQIAFELVQMGHPPIVWPSHNVLTSSTMAEKVKQTEKQILDEYARRLKNKPPKE